MVSHFYSWSLEFSAACCRGIGLSVGLQCCSPVAALVSEIRPLATLSAHAPLDVRPPLKANAKPSYDANPDKTKQASHASYSANPEKQMQASRDSYSANPEKQKQASRANTQLTLRNKSSFSY